MISVTSIDILIGISGYLFMPFGRPSRVFLKRKEEKFCLSPTSRFQDEIIAAQLVRSWGIWAWIRK